MTIADNRKAFHDYFIEDRYEAGIALEGWEVKAIRDARVQIKEAYVTIRDNELYLFGAHISALPTASTHIHPQAVRTRKLLLHEREIEKMIGAVERKVRIGTGRAPARRTRRPPPRTGRRSRRCAAAGTSACGRPASAG